MSEEDDEEVPKFLGLLRGYGPVLLFTLVLVLVIIGVFKSTWVTISWQIVALIGILLAIPYLNDIKRIWVPNLGGIDFKEDISAVEKQVQALFANLEEDYDISVEQRPDDEVTGTEQGEASAPQEEPYQIPSEPPHVEDLGGDPDQIAQDIYSVLDYSPRAALAKLRMETEEALNNYLAIREFPVDNSARYNDLRNFMLEDDFLERDFIGTYESVRDLCNRAIHGEEVDTDEAVDIVQIGIDLIRYLNEMSKRREEDKEPISEYENQQ